MTQAVSDAYGTILKERVPRTIRARADYDEYHAEVTSLMQEERLDAARLQYLNLLVTLIEAYERQHVRVLKAKPLDVLHELMDARGMKQADLVPFTGSSGTASEIYNGKRKIGPNLAKKLGRHFNVSFAVFL